MPDITPDELLGLARIAQLRVPRQDVESLTHRFNAVVEALSGALDQRQLGSVLPMPALQHPRKLPVRDRSVRPASPVITETDAPLHFKPITELAHLIRTRSVSPVELTEAYLARIDRYDGLLRSYITVTGAIARAEAKAAEKELHGGSPLGPLHGIPLAYKDQFYTKGVLTTCGTKVLKEFIPEFDASVVKRLHEAGAVMLGKLNMVEWAATKTLNFPFGQPRNPWNTEHDAGGSSTGSGIASAAGLCAGSLGEDTGGSIRRPASLNGCVGLRPSWGRVSTYGMVPGIWAKDTAGPLVRTVADCALLMNVIAGYDHSDPMCADLPVPDYTSVLDGNVKGMRMGLVKETQEAEHIHPEVKAAVAEAAKRFEELGAVVEEVSIPLVTLSSAFNGALGSERTALQWQYLNEQGDEFDAGARQYALLPGLLPAAIFQRAVQMWRLMQDQVLEACERYDVLLSPSQPDLAPRIKDTKRLPASKEEALRDTQRFSASALATYSATPAISVPCGFSQDGLPIGLQIMAKRFDEEAVFKAAHAYELSTRWHTMFPPLD